MLNAQSLSLSRNQATIPLLVHAVSAGFPSPADDYIDKNLDLNEYLIKHPAATYFMRANNNAMIGCGVHKGDLLIVDKSLVPENGKMIIAEYEGALTLRRLQKTSHSIALIASNKHYPAIHIDDVDNFCVWGVVTNIIHKV